MVSPIGVPMKLDRERGATAVEYALMASLVAAVVALSVGVFGGVVVRLFDSSTFP